LKNPNTDYQQVTNINFLPEFTNNSPSLDFIAQKSKFEKSICKQNKLLGDKVIFYRSVLL